MGIAGTRFTIQEMRKQVVNGRMDPRLIELCGQIIKGVPAKDYEGEAKAIFDWVKANIRYTRDPNGVELIQAPLVTVRRGAGDCDDHAVLLCALCESCGMRTGFETVRADSTAPDLFSHVYSIVGTNNGWRALDTTVQSSYFGWRPTAGVYGSKIWLF